MNLLFVDDEIYIVRALQKHINWNAIGIDNTFMAFNVEKAMEIFREQQIDVLITDIEMPRICGLELLKWVREEGYTCKSICLTCYSEFQYAQTAMHYQVSEYILKPIDFLELEKIVEKTVRVILEEQKQKEERSKGILWNYNLDRLKAIFWKEMLLEKQDTDSDDLWKKAEKVNITWDINQQYQVILFSIKRIYSRKLEWYKNNELMQDIIYSISRDVFLGEEDCDKIGWTDLNHMWAIIPVERSIQIREKLEKYVEMCYQETDAGIVAYMDEICYGEELNLSYQRLMDYDQKNVFLEKGVFDINCLDGSESLECEFYQKFRNYLCKREFQEAGRLVETLWVENSYMSQNHLILNVSAGQYEIYRCMDKNQIKGEQFWNDDLMYMMDRLNHSAGIYKDWLKESIKRLEYLCNIQKKDCKVIDQIKQYIEEHIEEKISREDIAKSVCFSTDYISKLFKKNAGISLSEFILEQKIEHAKKLIEEDENSIGNIAILLGYNSFSYFSEIFRRVTGVLPSEYKRTTKK